MPSTPKGGVASLRRRGLSERMIRLKLKEKGLSDDTIREALAQWAADAPEDGDLQAAINLARRRRLGPFRPTENRAERRDRDLAALARAGFDGDTARRVVDAEAIETDENGIAQIIEN